MKERSLKKQHPFAMLSKLTGSALLLLLPVIQQLLYRPQNAIEIIGSMGISALYAIGVITGAIIFYNTCRYKRVGHGIYLERGVLIKRKCTIPFENVSTVTVERNVFAAISGAARISVDTPAGMSKKRDISLYMRRNKVKFLINKMLNGLKTTFLYTADNFRMVLMSALWSNPMTGLLLLAPLIQKTGNILGKEFNSIVIQSVDFRTDLVSVGITPAAATIANILVLGWAVAMMFQFFRYARFSSSRIGNYIAITRGIGNKNERYTKIHEVSALTISRTLSMAMLKLRSAGIFAVGSGKDKGDKSLIAIAANDRELGSAIKGIVGFDTHYRRRLRPEKSRILSYIMIPLIVTAAVLALVSLLIFVPILDDLYFTALWISLAPLAWWIAFRVYAFYNSSIGYNKTCAMFCGYRKLSLVEYVIPYQHIQFVEIRQNLFQQHSGFCNVRVYLYYEKKAIHTVKHLRLADAEEIVKQMERRIG